ncbi:hypothetical protein [Vibrio natriegens]|uniref:hypothetical protein n=1 Tax=Vibrio natriegens TaxID=691 RepID=UPI003B596C53
MKSDKNKTLYLHVGFHKTASSSIQLELFKNKDVLNSYGYHYPKGWRFNHNFLFGMFCDNPELFYENVLNEIKNNEIIQNYQKLKEIYEDELNNTNCGNFILSSEDLSVLEESGLIRLKKYLDNKLNNPKIKIVICVRGPISFATSDIQQSIKVGYNFSFDNYNSIYKSRISKFIDIFGLENIIIFKFEDAVKNKKGPTGEFLSAIGLPDTIKEHFSGVKINESFSSDAVELMKFINQHAPISDGKSLTEGRTPNDTIEFSKHKGARFRLSQEEVNVISSKSREDVAWLKDVFNIDYSDELSKPALVNKNEIESSFLEFIELNFSTLTPLIKKLTIQYLVEKVEKSITDNEIDAIIKTLSVLSKKHFSDISAYSYSDFYDGLKNNKMAFSADLFREAAFSLRKKEKYKHAYNILLISQAFRPEGDVIKQTLSDLQGIIRNENKQ